MSTGRLLGAGAIGLIAVSTAVVAVAYVYKTTIAPVTA